MKYLVTGGAGFIGSHIAERLIQQNDSVIVLDNLNTGKLKNLEKILDDITFVNGDIRDEKIIEKLLDDVDGVFHQAALASVQDSFLKTDEYYDVNVNGTENIFKQSSKKGIKVVYASSSSVYGNPKKLPVDEQDEKNPFNPYAKTKLEDEKLAENYSKKGAKIIGLRYFNVFGFRQSKEYAGVIKLFLEKISKKESPKINGDGMQTRDFVHVRDVVNANILSMTSEVDHEFFNVGTNFGISVLDLANMIIDASGLNISPIHGPALQGDVNATLADISLINKKLGWNHSITLKDWLEDVIKAGKIDEV
jgi:UDP-glucose 4-epimerase